MALTIVCGHANAGKTGIIKERLLAAVAEGRQPILLLPGDPDVLEMLREIGPDCPLGLRITQFDRYLDSLWDVHGDGRVIIRPVQRLALLRMALTRTSPGVLARSSQRHGFHRMLEELVKRAGERVALDGQRSRLVRPQTAAADLCAIVDAYALLLRERGLVEPTEAHALVPRLCSVAEVGGPFFIHRFASFTPPQEAFVRWVGSSGTDVTTALVWVPDHPATEATVPLGNRLSSIPGSQILTASDRWSSDPELVRIQTALFASDPPDDARGIPPSGTVVLSEAAGGAGEAQRIVREIQILEESGTPFGEIAVVFRSLGVHDRAVGDAMSTAGIAYEMDGRIPLSRTGLGRSLQLLLRAVTMGHQRADVLGFMRSGYAFADPDVVDKFDARMRRARIDRGWELEHRLPDLGRRAASTIRLASDLLTRPVDEAWLAGWFGLLGDLMRAAWGDTQVSGLSARLDAAAESVVLAAVGELAALGEPLSAEALLDVIGQAEVTLSSTGDPECVQLMSAERARSRRFSAVILGGLTAGEFPLRAADDALSGGPVAEALTGAGIDVAPRVDLVAERLLFYQVVTGARRSLVLSRQASDDDGRPMRPSVFWEEFLDLYRDPTLAGPADGGGSFAGMPPVRSLGIADLAQAPDAPADERRELREAAKQGLVDLPRVRAAISRVSSREECLSVEAAAAFASREVFSVSEIESYLTCPYRWFYERRLSARPLDMAIDALEKGRLAHDVMRRFYEALRAAGHARVTEDNLPEALALAEREIAAVLREASAPRSLAEEELHHRVGRGVRRVVERDAVILDGFVPLHHELPFGADDAPADPGTFRLRGRIDRIDVGEAGLIVHDYKGSSVTPRARFSTDGVVQLPLYAVVAARLLNVPVVGGLYRSMGNAGDRGFYVRGVVSGHSLVSTDACSTEEIGVLLDDAIGRATDAVRAMRSGDIPAQPVNDACAYCAAQGVCRRRP